MEGALTPSMRHVYVQYRCIISSNAYLMMGITDGRNDHAIADALEVKFLEKYFPEDVRSKKEIEFLELKEGNMIVAKYSTKFEELMKLSPHYNGVVVEGSKCIKFENELKPEIKKGIVYQEIHRARSTQYKSVSERKGDNKFRGKPYSSLVDKEKQRTLDEKKSSGGVNPAYVKCFKSDKPICYNCGERGHISTNYQKSKKEQSGGKVLFLSGIETTIVDHLIRGMGILTLWVCLNYRLTIYGKSFGMDLMCLPLRNLDVILGMNWLEFNHVHINYFFKTVSFPEFDISDELFISYKQVNEFVKDGVIVFMILAFMKTKTKFVLDELPVVSDFPDDISDFLPELEMEFSIDLILGTSSVSMTPYRMFASKLV
ncbi:uncharacterized protein LOC127081044 [Lathyrus oleraceus]|uniref:uncharacterized protein LOC127081044 n=1 Tax=Pisum sativum TaxID=3888 RepID=UPI0021D06A3E|nr:uncharacterized protein LOC127081044 [Pisum sativum]